MKLNPLLVIRIWLLRRKWRCNKKYRLYISEIFQFATGSDDMRHYWLQWLFDYRKIKLAARRLYDTANV